MRARTAASLRTMGHVLVDIGLCGMENSRKIFHTKIRSQYLTGVARLREGRSDPESLWWSLSRPAVGTTD